MKKNFLLATMALFMTLFVSSCSQEEIISDNNSKGDGTVSVAVNIPVNNPVTRAVPNIPEGYKLRCILQLVNSSNNENIEGGRQTQEVAAGSEKITFTFNAPSEPYKCLFWADYVGETDINTDNIYSTSDLKAIGYTANAGSEMFKGDVADAFYACSPEPVSGSGSLTSITMKRPFTKITFKDGQSAYTDYTKITIKDLPAPTGFNVMNGETAGYAGKESYESSQISSSDLTVENGKWFSVYLFASSNKESLGAGNDIIFELKKEDGTTSGQLKLNGASITLTENVEVEATVEPKKDSDTSIDVIFPGGMNDATQPKVGQYLYKDGTWGDEFKKDNTIGIVFSTKNSSITDESDYGDSYTGKEIVGYAMAITSVARTTTQAPRVNNEAPTLPSDFTASGEYANAWKAGDYNGYKYTSNFISGFGEYQSQFVAKWNEWVTANNHSVTHLSPWYIPSGRQLLDILGMALGYSGDTEPQIDAVTKNNDFATAYTTSFSSENGGNDFPAGYTTGVANMVTSYVTSATQIAAIQLAEGGESFKKVFNTNINNSFAARPVLTIFKAE